MTPRSHSTIVVSTTSLHTQYVLTPVSAQKRQFVFNTWRYGWSFLIYVLIFTLKVRSTNFFTQTWTDHVYNHRFTWVWAFNRLVSGLQPLRILFKSNTDHCRDFFYDYNCRFRIVLGTWSENKVITRIKCQWFSGDLYSWPLRDLVLSHQGSFCISGNTFCPNHQEFFVKFVFLFYLNFHKNLFIAVTVTKSGHL